MEMTIDEAIKRYNNNAEHELTLGSLQGCLEFRQLAEWLEELKRLREQTKWIPVSERLPENKECVLVSLRHFTGRHTVDIGSMVFLEGIPHWHILGQSLAFNEVEAWMSLPEPYNGEAEE